MDPGNYLTTDWETLETRGGRDLKAYSDSEHYTPFWEVGNDNFWGEWRLRHNPQSLADALQRFESLIELLPRMRCGHDSANPRLTFGHGWECNACAKHSFFEEFAAEIHGQAAFADDNRRDWRLTGWRVLATDIEAEIAEFFLEVTRVLPKSFDQFGFVL